MQIDPRQMKRMMQQMGIKSEEIPARRVIIEKDDEKIVIENGLINLKESDRVCLYALGGLLPYLTVLYRETPEVDWINQKQEIQCPDNKNTVIFEIERVKTH